MKQLVLCTWFFAISIGGLCAQGYPVVMEAESASLGSDFEVVVENGVSYIRQKTAHINASYPGNASKVATYTVAFTETGNYHLYAKVRVGSGGYNDDSFYAAKAFGSPSPTDGNGWHIVNGIVPVGHNAWGDVVTGVGTVGMQVWKWINVSRYLNSQNPIVYQVGSTDSPQLFCIGSREDGLDFDEIAFGKAELEYTVKSLELVEPGKPEGGFPIEAWQKVKTFINPVLPGDHPDQTLLRDGNDFYSAGSSFHFTPYLPIYHSTDLVNWRIVSRVVPSTAMGINDSPSVGVWQGALARFGNYYWVYYSISSAQYFSKSTSMHGPWSAPVKVTAATVTGYDNSIFVDDDGTPYMLMKNGKFVNRIQPIDPQTGQLTGELVNLDFLNADGQYSWAEGPVMCKRDGWYYYFVAGNVGGGQWVLRTQSLKKADAEKPENWQAQGAFFGTITDPLSTFRSPNHVSQPIRLDDGSWWALSHCYEMLGSNDWGGRGRQGLLHEVSWDEMGKPTGSAPSSMPQLMPNLPRTAMSWSLPRTDSFDGGGLKLHWHFLNNVAASQYSLTEKPGWLTINAGSGSGHVLQKEGGYIYSLVTLVDVNALANGQEAGLYITNGNESVSAGVYSGYNNGKMVGFRFNGVTIEVPNTIGNSLWLKVDRNHHQLTGFYSANGFDWVQIGNAVSSVDLDKAQPSYNWWVGTSIGLYANKASGRFDRFVYRDGFSGILAIAADNYFGTQKTGEGLNAAMINTSDKGGWLMLGGIDCGNDEQLPAIIEVAAASALGGSLEIWLDDIEESGTLLSTIQITSTGSITDFQPFQAPISGVKGQHDLYLRWSGAAGAFSVKDVKLKTASQTLVNQNDGGDEWDVFPNPFKTSLTVSSRFNYSNYSLINIDGKLMETGSVSSGSQSIGAHIMPGVYLLKLSTTTTSQVVKVCKVK